MINNKFQPTVNYEKLCDILAPEQRADCKSTTLIIGFRLNKESVKRQENLSFLLKWINYFFGDLFDILIVEQDVSSQLEKLKIDAVNYRHVFIYNPEQFNRGWGYNVAVKNYCTDSRVVVFLDTDILLGDNFIDCILKCHEGFDFISPYQNIYYTNEVEAALINENISTSCLGRLDALNNPVTITGGILIANKKAFLELKGFEQYRGYAGEDRALDVTILNHCNFEKVKIAYATYVHLYHPREHIDRSNTLQIMDHLKQNYNCSWIPDLDVRDYIHKDCNHVAVARTTQNILLKENSFGNPDIYKDSHILTINGQKEASFYMQNSMQLPVINRLIVEEEYTAALRLISEAIRLYAKSNAGVLIDILKKKRIYIQQKKRSSGVYDFIFIPHKKYHTDTFRNIADLLQEYGFTYLFVNPSPPHPEESAYACDLKTNFISYDEFIDGDYYPLAIVCANDWERPVVQPIIQIANHFLIPTIGLVEGVNDFHDVDIRIPGNTGHYRNAYRTVRNLFLNGDFDIQYFKNSRQNIYVTGVGRLDILNEYRQRRKARLNSTRRVIANVNFTYGVLEQRRKQWINDINLVCKKRLLELRISKHPQDNAEIGDIQVSQRTLYEDLTDCDIFITRFSGAILEAIYIGCPVIYYNPNIEKIDKFNDPMGAYLIAKNADEVEASIKSIYDGYKFDVTQFLNFHADISLDNNIDKSTASSKKSFDRLESISQRNQISLDVLRRYKASLQEYVRKECHDVFKVFLPVVDISCYSLKKNVISCQCLNVDIENLVNRIIIHDSRLYLLERKLGEFERKLIDPDVWNNQISSQSEEICIHYTDIDLSSVKCTGYLANITQLKRDLSPGLTFLIRAKNEYKNIYFVLGSLRAVLKNKRFNCEVVFIDNDSNDGTYEEVERVCRSQYIENVFLYRYNVDISKSGDEHETLGSTNQMYRSLDTYYNWCLDKANKFNIVKWDADFLAINDNLIEMLERYDLSSLDKKTAIWFSGKTIFKNKNEFFVNLNTGYNEFRIFSKLHGYKWDYAPRWEISSRIFMQDCEKIVYTKSVYLELKDLEINEFEHRTNGAFISTCTRDSQDYALMSLIKNGEYSDQKKILACGIEPTDFVQIDFNPLLPTFYDTTQFNRYECTFKELESLQEYWLNNYSQKSKPILFQNPGNLIVQGLWVGEKITDLHRMCVESFIKNGHCFILYVYDDVANLPDGVVIMNAAEILPESLVYKFNDSYAGFSDIFRSKLLYSRGGWYVDLDIFNLKRFDFSNKMVYSLDHYPENGPVVVSETGMTIFPVNEKYYCATNPIKMPKGHSMAEAMYRRCFEKIFSERMFADVFGRDSNIHVHRERLEGYITNMGLISDFNAYFTDVRQLNELISFSDILAKTRISIDDMGQKTWNEIGPRLVTKKVLEYGLSDCMFEPWYFQGFIPYYEAEKFIDPNFDFRSPLELQNGYSIDLFFTMWRNKELLEKKDRIDGTFYKYLQSLVNH